MTGAGARHLATAVVAVVVAVALTACSEQISSSATLPATVVTTAAPVVTSAAPVTTTAPPETTTTTTSSSTTTTSTTTTTTTTLPPVPIATSCDKVVHIGDSTGEPLFQAAGVGGAEFMLDVRYRAVGVEVVYPDNDGARSLVERVNGAPNAIDVAQAVRDNGYDGCWVIMIGTNDAANIAAGSNIGAEQRIRSMMAVIGSDPVMWVDTVSQRTDNPYKNASMLAWNQELYRVLAEYPNARVFRWYDVVRPEWFRNDGIHYTVEGSNQRAALTAQALVVAFPAS